MTRVDICHDDLEFGSFSDSRFRWVWPNSEKNNSSNATHESTNFHSLESYVTKGCFAELVSD